MTFDFENATMLDKGPHYKRIVSEMLLIKNRANIELDIENLIEMYDLLL